MRTDLPNFNMITNFHSTKPLMLKDVKMVTAMITLDEALVLAKTFDGSRSVLVSG
jgi:hypothetical protein